MTHHLHIVTQAMLVKDCIFAGMRVFFFFLFISNTALGNDTLIITQLLNRIEQLQSKTNGIFPKGAIPSYRRYSWNETWLKPDVNPFFTSLVAFTLDGIKQELTPHQRVQADAIITSTLPSYEKFRNRKTGRPTYNTWPTDTPTIFPYSGLLSRIGKRQAPPDDLDDTVMILMAMRAHDSTARWVHAFMQSYTNNENKKITNTYKEYSNIGAYSTWFGVKMPVEFDICVMANVLYFVQFYNLKWTAADSACLRFIEQVVQDKRHLTAAYNISPQYRRAPVILYHFSRLMSFKPIPELERLKPQLIEETLALLSRSETFMDEVILSTALLRWGVTPPLLPPRKTNSLMGLVESDKFSFYVANMASVISNPWKPWIQATRLGLFYFHCPAYNNLLLLENLAWRKRRNLP